VRSPILGIWESGTWEFWYDPEAAVDRPILGGYVSRDYPFREIGDRGFGSSVDKRSGSRLDKSQWKRECGYVGRGLLDQGITQGANHRFRLVWHFGILVLGILKGMFPRALKPQNLDL
jgi:hypothetical protein